MRRGLRVAALAASLIAASLVAPAGVALHAATSAPAIRGDVDAGGLKALIAEHRGRVLLVNFWATWCVPCREEFPDLDRLQRELSPRGLTVIGISTDFASQTAAVERFLRETHPSFVNYRKKSGGDDQVFIDSVDPNWGGELPYSVIYRPDGTRARTLSGKRSFAEYRREVLTLLEPR